MQHRGPNQVGWAKEIFLKKKRHKCESEGKEIPERVTYLWKGFLVLRNWKARMNEHRKEGKQQELTSKPHPYTPSIKPSMEDSSWPLDLSPLVVPSSHAHTCPSKGPGELHRCFVPASSPDTRGAPSLTSFLLVHMPPHSEAPAAC